ncbi:hypothetical protein GCM10025776_03500 [Corallincola platygyrae]
MADIHFPNYGNGLRMDPVSFLAARANDAPFYFPIRQAFVKAYLAQRAACRSMASLPSSAVELEPHQVAVVRRILQDDAPKFLLADEVGLGKTIEAGLVIREHVLEKKRDARVLVAVPESLIGQWREELSQRFALGDLLDSGDWDDYQIRICPHENIAQFVSGDWQPTLFAVDEAHQIAPLAWSSKTEEQARFSAMSALSAQAEVALLLSGTPMHGNEKNFLAMLHCLSPEAYRLDPSGIEHFLMRVGERERLGGLYSALTEETPNAALEANLDELADLLAEDANLHKLAERLRPLVDLFAPEEGDERASAIYELRSYIGEHYRLHHRLLRNRRENSALSYLFPGLAGLRCTHWPLSSQDVCLDELIEEYRNLALAEPDSFKAMSEANCLEWVDDLFVSPRTVGQRAKAMLEQGGASEQERLLLEQICQSAKQEQQAKDQALINALTQWLEANPKGKAVVFCSLESVASYLYVKFELQLEHVIERHQPGRTPSFNQPDSPVRVLICDHHGEDGLNLHGGHRLAVHYSISRNFSRIEQRLGRLNRYSANLHGVGEIASLIALPQRAGITSEWVDLLNRSIGLFDQTVASLQFVLKEFLETAWQDFVFSGCSSLRESAARLAGEDGLIVQERKRVHAQEQLLSLEQEVIEAQDFADHLAEADDLAESQANDMLKWITKALNFSQKRDANGGFRLRFETGEHGSRTLVDVRSFIDTCLLGLDFDNGYPPSTEPMSFSRSQASEQVGVYPFRYGQPFVDTVWQLMQADPRGTTSALLRVIPSADLREPKMFFQFYYLTTAQPKASGAAAGNPFIAQRRADELICPQVDSVWLTEAGRPLDPCQDGDTELVDLLEKPYNKNGLAYQDVNLRSNVWTQLSAWLPAEPWRQTVLSVANQAQTYISERYRDKTELNGVLKHQVLAVRAVLLCGSKTFSE